MLLVSFNDEYPFFSLFINRCTEHLQRRFELYKSVRNHTLRLSPM